MQQAHDPANAEQRCHKPAKAIRPVAEALAVGALGGQAQHNAGYKRQEQGRFKVIQVEYRHVVSLSAGS